MHFNEICFYGKKNSIVLYTNTIRSFINREKSFCTFHLQNKTFVFECVWNTEEKHAEPAYM